MTRRGIEVSLLTGVLPKSKTKANESFSAGFNHAFSGVLTLLSTNQKGLVIGDRECF
jgi:hypothetical protein